MTYILYSSLANSGDAFRQAFALMHKIGEENAQLRALNKFDPREILELTEPGDTVILLGGDGTLNRFANSPGMYPCRWNIQYRAGGTGNDFYRDVREFENSDSFPLTPYLQKLPVVRFADRYLLFVNGVGAGLDGYCCSVMDEARRTKKRMPSYASVALRGLLYKFKPLDATVTVDGTTHWFKHVYIATTMFGRYYGGGIKIAPDQMRANTKQVSVVVVHSRSRLAVLPIFTTIFKGTHVKHTKYVTVLTGNDITVSFDRACPMQVDGEVFPPVSTYHITAPERLDEVVAETQPINAYEVASEA
ncbi:MAG: hypothetical protein IJC88_05025 [Oscillospiraceae bacterium]|nr:hypothetical protein [Oscillospiraceae bacterium]